MRHTVLSYMPCMAVPYFPWHDFWKKCFEHKISFSLQLLSETFLILRRIPRDTVTKCVGRNVKHPLFLLDFNETGIFSPVFPCGRTDGRVDRHDEIKAAFHNSTNAPTRGFIILILLREKYICLYKYNRKRCVKFFEVRYFANDKE